MNFDADKLLALLPALYRARDLQQLPPGPLQAPTAVAADQIGLLEEDIARLYDNWFIETCEEWTVPYIGDLIGARLLHPASARTFSRRAWVANTLGYRRRKGTATMLEQLARDTTGWPAHAVEFFQRLAWSQNVNHVRRDAPATVSLRSVVALEQKVGGAFDLCARTVDVRSIARGRGRLNIPNVGLFLWRLQSQPIGRVGALPGDLPADFGSARAYRDGHDGRYTFGPWGLDGPLFNNPRTETTVSQLASEVNVPGVLRRRALHDELEARRQALVDGTPPPPAVYFDGERAVLRVLVRAVAGGALQELAPEVMAICALADPPAPAPPPADWRRPADKVYARRGDTTDLVTRSIAAAVDPLSGRLAFRSGQAPAEVFVLYSHGFPGDVGGGPYDRADTIDSGFHLPTVWQVGVSRVASAVGPERVLRHLADAIDAWNHLPAGSVGVIALMDSTSEFDDAGHPLPPVRLLPGSRLLLVAADWPVEPVPGATPGVVQRRAGVFAADDVRPHFRGDLVVEGAAPLDPADADSSNPGELTINGLLLEGQLRVREAAGGGGGPLSGNLGSLRIAHCALRPTPGRRGVLVAGDNGRLKLSVDRSIVFGGIELPASVTRLALGASVVDGASAAIVAPGSALAVEACTVRGTATALTVDASNSIFGGALVAERRQTGCVRFSSLAEGSKTPRRHRCQPDLALSLVSPQQAAATRLRLAPQFTSARYGDPAYLQLAAGCAAEIRTGADDGSEMGVWSFLKQPQREANLLGSLDEYLRLGLAAGIVHAT